MARLILRAIKKALAINSRNALTSHYDEDVDLTERSAEQIASSHEELTVYEK